MHDDLTHGYGDMPGLAVDPVDECDMPPLEDSSMDEEEVEPPGPGDLIIMDEIPLEIIGPNPRAQDPYLINRMTGPNMGTFAMAPFVFTSSDPMPTGSAIMSRFIPYPMPRRSGPRAAQ